MTSDGDSAGTVEAVLEVARITNVAVELSIDAAALAALPERGPKGAPEFQAATGRRFGRLWRRR